jgi:hypothetical protein
MRRSGDSHFSALPGASVRNPVRKNWKTGCCQRSIIV